MTDFEDDLRQALKRQEPAADFSARVLARCNAENAGKRLGGWRWFAAAAALLVMSGGITYERQVRGMDAKRRVMLAMRIAGTKLQEVQRRVRESEQVEE